MGKARIIVLAGIAALALAGCLKQDVDYWINEDGTVDANLRIQLHEDFVDLGAPYRGVPGVEDILDHFTTDTIVEHDSGEWIGYFIQLNHEPMSSFTGPAMDSWDLEIRSDGDYWVALGVEYDPEMEGVRQAILDNGGYLTIDLLFPGDVVDESGAFYVHTSAPGVVSWNLTTVMEQPYAAGGKAPPSPDPPDPPDSPDPPDPGPVVTPVATSSPVVTPSGTPSPSALPTPSASPGTTAGDEDGGIPTWVWGVGGLLLGSLTGLGIFMIVNRPKEELKPTDPESRGAKPKAAKPAETTKKGNKKTGSK